MGKFEDGDAVDYLTMTQNEQAPRCVRGDFLLEGGALFFRCG